MRDLKIRVPGVAPEEAADPPNDADLARGAQFFDVGGLPVSLGKVQGSIYRCAQWSSGRPVMFSEATLESSGKRITEAAFRDLVTACRLGY